MRLKPSAADDPETGKQHLLGFFDREPTLDPDLSRYAPETASRVGRELLLHFPNGAGKSKLAITVLERAYGARLTMRNWVTVKSLAEMA